MQKKKVISYTELIGSIKLYFDKTKEEVSIYSVLEQIFC